MWILLRSFIYAALGISQNVRRLCLIRPLPGGLPMERIEIEKTTKLVVADKYI